jgi:uncharacterized protein Veg
MNLNIIRDKISKQIGRSVIITVKGNRNRKQIYEGKLYKMYPNIFSIMTNSGEKTFSYSDVATKEVLIKY